MKKFTKNQGITLIALIITIIVMLILVAVTINVALNGGLFTRAKEAAFKTEIQQIQEQISLKKAEQAADNEINGTTGYNITLDNIGISTELKNKYRNKLSISSTGELQYDPDNCTNEEKAYLASIGAKSGAGTVSVSNKLEFDMRAIETEYDNCDVAKYIFEDGVFSIHFELTQNEQKNEITYIGSYTYLTDTEDYKFGEATLERYSDGQTEIELDDDVKEDVKQFEIYTLKENGQIVNMVFHPVDSGNVVATTNGKAGITNPDSDLIGVYYNQDESKSITISLDNYDKRKI